MSTYEVVVRDTSTPATTLFAAVGAMMRACADDPGVTCMPYIRRADGSLLTDEENDLVDSYMGDITVYRDLADTFPRIGK